MAENFVQTVAEQIALGNLPTPCTTADLKRVMVPLGYSANTCQVFPSKHAAGKGNTPHFMKVGQDAQRRNLWKLMSSGAAAR